MAQDPDLFIVLRLDEMTDVTSDSGRGRYERPLSRSLLPGSGSWGRDNETLRSPQGHCLSVRLG